ncbi:prolipoprotein diacylglyceryl transferase [Spiroplasma sp. TIUS-1]|uniref:prolipoprotein diacylglyceryl transferase n=1 Tax=Spiroplasma sp. TIUS-1 TaxID=216963 RepID=UPI001398053B|nr:prolipoprotein diacylglyceryl transferase family protein [Spiroplasma sp. TIUS-1]QHX35616.1 prolipoprotein diacylglyceryl transferase [Spiroplasma sp. TIUS-1]
MNWWNNWENNEYGKPGYGIWTFDEQLQIGGFQGYALVISSSILVAIVISVISCRIRKIPVTEIIIALSVLVPFSLMGASLFGKIGIKGYSHNIIDLIAFWEAGMAIHGGILFAAIGATPLAWYVSRKYKISILAILDSILPHILLSQAIGRWGNYFNHELMGPPMTELSGGSAEALSLSGFWRNLVLYGHGNFYIMHPYFLYESIGLGLAWALIIGAPYFVSLFSGPNKKYKDQFYINANDTFKSLFVWNKEWPHSYQGVWNEAFIDKINSEERIKYEENLNTYKTRWQKGKALYKANNPDNYIVLHSGVKTGAYLFLWNIVRVFLEVSKAEDSLFIKYDKPLSVTLISLTALAGLAIALLCQFVAPYVLRKTEYKYEKQYFYLSK